MIYDILMEEMRARRLYLCNEYGPFYLISYAMHHFNLINRKVDIITDERQAIYWVSGEVPDMRNHLLFITPSGFMKTTYLKAMISLLGKSGANLIMKEGMSEAGLVGTISKDANGRKVNHVGIAETFADDIILIDEFSILTGGMKAAHNAMFNAYLLAILDHGFLAKDLASGGLEYSTRITMWAGVQPSHYELSSGLGRRFLPMIFLPTRYDNTNLIKLKKETANIREDRSRIADIHEQIQLWLTSFSVIEKIEYSDRVYDFYMDPDNNFFQFECDVFNRFLLGYHLLKYGASPNMKIDISDPELERLITLQRDWRRTIYDGVDTAMLLQTMSSMIVRGPKETMICSIPDVVNECKMVSWNRRDVIKKLKEMEQDNYIKIIGNVITWLSTPT
ncbi:MAG: hypothetical protein D4S01_00845 [Dehalococcoidia bacterium]|nr:MAG: hypothetical protein D4S01_00845 [Dehalococcoidia bacterium]